MISFTILYNTVLFPLNSSSIPFSKTTLPGTAMVAEMAAVIHPETVAGILLAMAMVVGTLPVMAAEVGTHLAMAAEAGMVAETAVVMAVEPGWLLSRPVIIC